MTPVLVRTFGDALAAVIARLRLADTWLGGRLALVRHRREPVGDRILLSLYLYGAWPIIILPSQLCAEVMSIEGLHPNSGSSGIRQARPGLWIHALL